MLKNYFWIFRTVLTVLNYFWILELFWRCWIIFGFLELFWRCWIIFGFLELFWRCWIILFTFYSYTTLQLADYIQTFYKKYHYFETVPKSNREIVERGKIDTLTHIYITGYFRGLFQALLFYCFRRKHRYQSRSHYRVIEPNYDRNSCICGFMNPNSPLC